MVHDCPKVVYFLRIHCIAKRSLFTAVTRLYTPVYPIGCLLQLHAPSRARGNPAQPAVTRVAEPYDVRAGSQSVDRYYELRPAAAYGLPLYHLIGARIKRRYCVLLIARTFASAAWRQVN